MIIPKKEEVKHTIGQKRLVDMVIKGVSSFIHLRLIGTDLKKWLTQSPELLKWWTHALYIRVTGFCADKTKYEINIVFFCASQIQSWYVGVTKALKGLATKTEQCRRFRKQRAKNLHSKYYNSAAEPGRLHNEVQEHMWSWPDSGLLQEPLSLPLYDLYDIFDVYDSRLIWIPRLMLCTFCALAQSDIFFKPAQ